MGLVGVVSHVAACAVVHMGEQRRLLALRYDDRDLHAALSPRAHRSLAPMG
jgi:hypothetical protein